MKNMNVKEFKKNKIFHAKDHRPKRSMVFLFLPKLAVTKTKGWKLPPIGVQIS